MGAVDNGELLALKRIGFLRDNTRVSLAFSVPQQSCRQIYSLYLMSDCYLGLDQQCEISISFTISDIVSA